MPSWQTPKARREASRTRNASRTEKKTLNNENVTCEFCDNKGHVMSKCFKFEAARKAAKATTAEKKVKFSDKKILKYPLTPLRNQTPSAHYLP